MKQIIEQYISEKQLAWAPSTQRSERHRLISVADLITGDPNHLWLGIQSLKPYTRVTTWTRVTDFYQWGLDNDKLRRADGELEQSSVPVEQGNGREDQRNSYQRFRETNSRLFKHTYRPRFPSISFTEAVARIQTLADSDVRGLAEFLLYNGARFDESKRYSEGSVIGKGSKTRAVFGPAISTESSKVGYQRLRRHLKKLNLTPHQLRKLCATELVNKGCADADLMKIMGWDSIATSRSYLIPKQDAELKQMFKEMRR